MKLVLTLLLLLAMQPALGEDEEKDIAAQSGDAEQAVTEGSRTMSGMSILGNEEAPKALVIVPWKSSLLGDEVDLSNVLGDRAEAVDKEVFMRHLRYFEIRSAASEDASP